MDAHAGTTRSDAASGGFRPRLSISMGDPGGIGAEIICKALADEGLRKAARYRVHGSERVMLAACRAAGIVPFWSLEGVGAAGRSDVARVVLIDEQAAGDDARFAPEPSARGGALSFAWVENAIRDAQRPAHDAAHADAIVTAPISKTSWNLAGHTKWPGHTELLAERFDAPRSGMLFVGPRLCVMLATIHVPLMRVGGMLTTERVLEAIELAHEGIKQARRGVPPRSQEARRGVSPRSAEERHERDAIATEHGQDARATQPRIAVCGLNPHAGEGGILGSEDDRIIAPAVAMARAKGIDAHGPLPGDTVFSAAAKPPVGKGLYDCVVAMYHDQGLIPVKLVDREETVNVTVGLPTIRTSPAHGTAFDIAGKNAASAASMRAAIELAIQMANLKQDIATGR